jgi:hydroxypyruvate isomerase
MYREHEPLDRFEAARIDGFQWVELCYLDDLDISEVRRALRNAGQTLLSFNFPPGEVIPDKKRGVSALPGHESEFSALVAQGLEWARELGAKQALGPLYGLKPEDASIADCEDVLIANLKSVADELEAAEFTLLLEPHCSKDFPGYIIDHLSQARRVIDKIDSSVFKILFDTYHVQRMEGDLANNFKMHQDVIAHVQVGNPSGRHEPDEGEVDHQFFFQALDQAGYDGWVVGEYLPKGKTTNGLGWIDLW